MMSETRRPARQARASPPPFTTAERSANCVELFDVGAGGAERASDADFVVERNAGNGRRQQCRAAAGDQAEAEVVWSERRDDFEYLVGSCDAFGSRFVDASGAGGVKMNALRRRQGNRRAH